MSSASSISSVSCHYYVNFDPQNAGIPSGCSSTGKWVFQPYIPFCNPDIITACEHAFIHVKNYSDAAVFFHLYNDAFHRSLVLLEVKDLTSFSQVSKCCYLASKSNLTWEGQLQKLFPNLSYISTEACGFTFEQQYIIYYKRMQYELKPYQLQLQINAARISELRGPRGCDGKLSKVWQKFENAGGNRALRDSRTQYHPRYCAKNPRITTLYNKYNALSGELIRLDGHTAQGEPVRHGSEQGRCLEAIETIRIAFNHQDLFEKTIYRTAAAKKGIPLPEDPFYPNIEENEHLMDIISVI